MDGLKRLMVVAAMCMLLVPCGHGAVSGSATVAGGGTVSFSGAASTNWVDNATTGTKDFVLVFTDTMTAGSFTLPGYAVVDTLVVAGGGAGGSSSGEGNNIGAGGGGGAGGLLYATSQIFRLGYYSVTVGAGGEPADDASGTVGGNGANSILKFGETTLAEAIGGGGGGAQSDGKAGGSGGGASRGYVSNAIVSHVGGEGTDGQGFAGGDHGGTRMTYQRAAAGGGGAGGKGGDVKTNKTGGAGGLGLACSITGEERFYAGGGGGGTRGGGSADVVGEGGSGVGGNGGGGASNVNATDGVDGTGSGGGGGTLTTKGGRGGSGVVVVRITQAFPGKLVRPEAAVSFTYDGTIHTSVVASAAWTVSGLSRQIDVGTYEATVTLNEGFEWEEGEKTGDVKVTMTIEKAQACVEDLFIEGWSTTMPADERPEPTCTIQPACIRDVATVTYGYGTSTNDVDFTDEKPTTNGVYYVRAQIAGGANYLASEPAFYKFTLADLPKEIYNDSVELTLSGYAGATTLTNFPVLVRVSEADLPGFLYSRVGSYAGGGLAFADEDGRTLPFEVDTWNVSGESLVWVRVPRLYGSADGRQTKITMHWNLQDGKQAADYAPQTVWSEYLGVWHFNEQMAAAAAADTASADATANGLDAWPAMSGAGDYRAEMVRVAGCVGGARQTTTERHAGGNRLDVSDAVDLALDGTFTFSGWFNCADHAGNSSNATVLVSRKAAFAETDGWLAQLTPAATIKSLRVFGGNYDLKNCVTATPWTSDAKESGWTYFAAAFAGTSARVAGANGATFDSKAGTVAKATDNGRVLSFGNLPDCATVESFVGAFDEFRLSRVARSADWLKAEYDTVNSAAFVVPALVSREGQAVNYWTVEPSLSPTEWDEGSAPGSLDLGSLKVTGSETVTTRVVNLLTGAELTFDEAKTTGGSYEVVVTVSADGYETMTKSLFFRVATHAPYDDLKDGAPNATVSGRILLANADKMAGHEVDVLEGQAYFQVESSGTPKYYYNPYWVHEGNDYAGSFYLRPGDSHTLNYVEGGFLGRSRSAPSGTAVRTIWTLRDVWFGNLYVNKTGSLDLSQCYLPISPTSLGITTYAVGSKLATADYKQVGNIVMKNCEGAVIYSQCYTNGVGTVYFDAVNGFTDGVDKKGYGLRVQYVVGTNELDQIDESDWKNCTLIPLKCNGGTSFDKCAETDELFLDVTTGGTERNFYRVCAPINVNGPVRFRIYRTTSVSGFDSGVSRFILLDNILVSLPSEADVKPYGVYDPTKTGKTVIGRGGAMNVPFPSVSGASEIYARGRAVTNVPATLGVDPASCIQLSRFHYQWHYLNQVSNGWKTVELRPPDFVATEPLDIPSSEGDVEFYYETFTQTPYFDYVDYSGLDLGLGGSYTEDVGTRISDRSFFRLRNGRSDWEAVSVSVSGAYAATADMELIGDHQWRGLVKVPATIKSGVSSNEFWFTGANRQTAGAKDYAMNTTTWYPTADVAKLPSRGEVSIGGVEKAYPVDQSSGYVEFTFNDESLVFTIGHAEYQNFNAWHDAKQELFVGTYSETSGVSTATMIQTNANMIAWPELTVAKEEWNEDFRLSNYDDEGYQKGVTFKTHKMPHQWNGELGKFVDTTLVKYSNPEERRLKSGLAWQMQGQGYGSMSYTSGSGPSGLDTVTVSARLAQSLTFDDFSVWDGAGASTAGNYTILLPALMSTSGGKDLVPGASMSLVAAYRAKKGCYEFRVSRDGSDGLMFAIYRWALNTSTYQIEPTCISSNFYSNATFWSGTANAPSMYGMFISIETNATATTISAGLSQNSEAPSSAYTSGKYRTLVFADASGDRLDKGAFGVLTTNCKGRFLELRHYAMPLTVQEKSDATISISTAMSLTRDQDRDREKMEKEWTCAPGRLEWYEDSTYTGSAYPEKPYGFRPPEGLAQTLEVYVKDRSSSDTSSSSAAWTKVDEIEVTDYAFKSSEIVVRTNADCHVMFRTGVKPVDVAIGSVTQTGWNGEDISNVSSGLGSQFVYTQAYVLPLEETKGETGVVTTNRYVKLQPARANAEKPLGLRSPVLDGVGMVGFSYTNVCPGCELWVQVATNRVSSNLGGSSGYNLSLREGTDVGAWQTVARYSYDQLVTANAQSHYFGWHTRVGDSLQGVVRVIVAPSVVTAAQATAKPDPERGGVTITDFWVHDEPALDTKSWLGWNIRTIGDAADTERRMYLPDPTAGVSLDGDVGSGLSIALNNSFADIKGTKSEYTSVNPTVQSPTMDDGASIGRVRIKARRYDVDGSGLPGYVALYGVTDGAANDWGEPLTNFVITSTTYEQHEYKASSKKKFAAIRLVVDGVVDRSAASPQRVLLDEVVVSDKSDTAIGFAYARPFRNGLAEKTPVADILSRDEQPLTDESWGVQTQLRLGTSASDVDKSRGFRVFLRYFVGDEPWGYANWETSAAASKEIELEQVGDADDLVFRSTTDNTSSIVPPTLAANTVVQYMLIVRYYEQGGSEQIEDYLQEAAVEGEGWTNPSWYWPVDYNRDDDGKDKDFAAYTILDAIAPGRAWINEVNYSNGLKNEGGVTNQFIELAVPWDVDMANWTIRVTDKNHYSATIAKLGRNGVPTKKKSDHRSGDYDFLVLQSPKTQEAGGIRDSENPSALAADGTWDNLSPTNMQPTFKEGILNPDMPYQFELVRPSGVVEHQVVMMGTNYWSAAEWAGYWDSIGRFYEGTNLLAELDADDPSPNRLYAGEDLARKPSDLATLASLGVTGDAHGEAGGWTSDMKFTPGRLNEGQNALEGWYITSNGETVFVYASVVGENLSQQIGDDTSRDTRFVMAASAKTNIVYTLRPWTQIDRIVKVTNANETNTLATAVGKDGSYTLTLSGITQTVHVVATEGANDAIFDAGLSRDDRYAPAIHRWLRDRAEAGTLANPNGPIALANYMGLSDEDDPTNLTLRAMYWLDLDPTEGNWWLRGGTTEFKPDVPRVVRFNDGSSVTDSDVQMRVKLYLSNDVSGTVYAPYRLQGLNNEKSDDPTTYGGNWTSETFQVQGRLNNGQEFNEGWLPFRWFVFDKSSFTPATDADPFTALIELHDPFSQRSPGYAYGWSAYPRTTPSFFRWMISEERQPDTVELLRSDSTYSDPTP